MMHHHEADHSQEVQRTSADPSPVILAEVNVETATALIGHPDDPYLILVGDSEKHAKPVLPGGKLESYEANNTQTPGIDCISREVQEEIGTRLLNPVYIGKANDPERDTRLVPPSKLQGALTSPALDDSVFNNEDPQIQIKAHYGTPDYIYRGTVDPQDIEETEELTGNRFIDIRTLEPGDLSAGHDLIVLRYREMLDNGAPSFPEDALSSFEAEIERYI